MNLSQLRLEQLIALRQQAKLQNDIEKLLQYNEELFQRAPNDSAWLDSCIYSAILNANWDKAIHYGIIGIERKQNYLNCLDGLAHAYYAKQDLENCCKYGSMALYHRHQETLKGVELPKLPKISPKKGKKVIAFSLFGGENPKYIEAAVLNSELSPRIYPNWVCRFYVDSSIPRVVKDRLSQNGAEVYVCDETFKSIPGTMWRFLALDDPTVSHAIFRDADSVISPREAIAVNLWLESGKYFHTLRDNGSQTDLVCAGLWGAVCGVLPNILGLILEFVKKGNLDSRFSDQDFLRVYLWKYIFQSLYATDSVFNFLDSHPFTGDQVVENFVGRNECASEVALSNPKWKNGTKLKWQLYSRVDPFIAENFDEIKLLNHERLVCEYETIYNGKKLVLNLPRRYVKHFKFSRINVEIVN